MCSCSLSTVATTSHPASPCRDAEQRARAAKLYDRQRQRFQRALLAAEDLEGADSSVFTAVSRKGSTNGSPGTQNAGSDAGGGAAEGAGGNPFMRGLPGGAAAAALAGADVEDEEEDSNADVFDPASWDDDVRRQWESFVSSSKVRGGCGFLELGAELAGAGSLLSSVPGRRHRACPDCSACCSPARMGVRIHSMFWRGAMQLWGQARASGGGCRPCWLTRTPGCAPCTGLMGLRTPLCRAMCPPCR